MARVEQENEEQRVLIRRLEERNEQLSKDLAEALAMVKLSMSIANKRSAELDEAEEKLAATTGTASSAPASTDDLSEYAVIVRKERTVGSSSAAVEPEPQPQPAVESAVPAASARDFDAESYTELTGEEE